MKLMDVVDEAKRVAKESDTGRHAAIVVHDGPLRQSVLALTEGTELAPHNSPPAASIFVIEGEITIVGTETDTIREGELKALTHVRHGVVANLDSVFLLTTVTGIEGTDSHDERE